VTRGTTPASVGFTIPFDEASIEEKDTKIVKSQAQGVIEDSVGEEIARQWAEGSFKAPLTEQGFGLILLSLLGSDTPTAKVAPNAAVYDHAMSVAQSVQHQSLSLYLTDAAATANAQDYSHALGVVESVEVAFETGKVLDFTAKIKAKKGVQGAVTPATVAEHHFLPQDVTVKFASALSGLAAASATKIRNLKLTINQNTESDEVLGDIGPNDYLNKNFSISGTLEASWDSEGTFKTAALAGTTQAMRVDIKNTRDVIGGVNATANPELLIDLAKVTFEEITRPWKVGDIVRQIVKFKAHYSTTDSKMVAVTLTNTVGSY
jgi:hypothetical protein